MKVIRKLFFKIVINKLASNLELLPELNNRGIVLFTIYLVKNKKLKF